MLVEVDGEEVYAADYGRPGAAGEPAVLFLHGAGMDHSVWTLQARWFAWHGFRALAVDLPGHRRSGGAPLATIEAAAAWVGRLMDAAGIADAWLVGHSMGSLIALETAAALPARVSGVGLVAAAAAMPVHAALLAAAAHAPKLAAALMSSWGHGRHGHLGGNRQPGAWMLGAAVRLLERAGSGVIHADLAACNAYAHGEAAAASLRCPALVVIGTQDRMTPPRAGRRLAGLIPGARTAEIAGAGHLMLAERPDAVLVALRAFIGQAPAAA
jgi:pimeloyl-ACP methyl ester carboxylesterase